jgi:hypothetical protein
MARDMRISGWGSHRRNLAAQSALGETVLVKREPDRRPRWAATTDAARGACLCVGGAAIIFLTLQQVIDISKLGVSGWADQGMSGGEFLTLLAVAIALVIIGLGLAFDLAAAIYAWRERRS